MSDDTTVVCNSYTRARRHPLLIGKIQGHSLPIMVSVTQVGVLAGGIVILVKTRGLWGPLVGGSAVEALVIIGLPAAAAFTVRHLRMEGRSPLRMAVALGGYLGRRSVGPQVGGRPSRESRPRRAHARKLFVTVEAPTARPVRATRGVRPRRQQPAVTSPVPATPAAAVLEALVAARASGQTGAGRPGQGS